MSVSYQKTPSFGVHSVHQFYKCFGCDAKGDLIKFVMEIEGTTFWESLKLLSDRYGIPMPPRQRPDDPEARSRDALFEMHEIAARTFEEIGMDLPGAMLAATWRSGASRPEHRVNFV